MRRRLLATLLPVFGCGEPPPAVPLITNGATALDVDGDGYADVLGGDGTQGLVFRGGPNGLGNPVGYGRDFAPTKWIGDVNGDGRADFIGESWVGDAPVPTVHFGTAEAGFEHLVVAHPLGDASEGQRSVSDIGDIDGDGDHEIVVARLDFGTSEPFVAIWLGGSDYTAAPDLLFTDADLPEGYAPELVRAVLRPAGDLDGDGYGDVHDGQLVYFGPTLERTSTVDEWPPPPAPDAILPAPFGGVSPFYQPIPNTSGTPGGCQSLIGDIDGDGHGDLLFTHGFLGWDGDADTLGAGQQKYAGAHVFLGDEAGLPATADISFTPPSVDPNGPSGEVFTQCYGLGDVDGDGYGDAAISIAYRLHVFYGGSTGLRRGRSEITEINIQNGVVATY